MTIILQANVHRSLTADSLLTKLVMELRADIVIVSEQYRDKDGPNWIPDLLRTAAVWIPDTRKFLIERKGAERGFAWVKSGRLTVVSIYLTPNERIEEFRQKLEDLEDFLNQTEGDILVAGDFNARGQEWGMPTTDSRGRQILEMAARRGLYVANVGNTPTFRRPGHRGTIPDVTFATGTAFAKIKNWRVIEDYTGSDHQYIVFDLFDNFDE
ncbi:uncharacterized protein LOC129906906 [Episyrphus balteatus]|uniref:uncharacterized protein LOC129906906 n=1 Tax=Episyrphus balteatus TaxID=286459 RepID=UPI002486B39F|nr:uncharacterized protein LOC129906906 [Episyrphus balteatus]